jgi:hypothetical protein
MDYVSGALKGAGMLAVVGAGLGAYSVLLDKRRRHVSNLGMPELVYLDSDPSLVCALSFIKEGRGLAAPMSVKQLALSLDQLIHDICRLENEQRPALKFHIMRRAGEARLQLRRIVERVGQIPDPCLEEQIGAINAFIENSEHNVVVI